MKTTLLLLTLLMSAAAFAQSSTCDPTVNDCTIGQALDFYRVAPVEKAVVNTNRPTESPDAFAGRIHNTYEDFLNRLSFAVNRVDQSDDGQSLVIRFNPLRKGRHLLGGTLTVTQPAVAQAVTDNIPSDLRDDTVKKLDAELDDFDNLTWSASYSFATPNCAASVPARRRCWGRSPASYRDLLAPVLLSVLDPDGGGVGDAVASVRELFQPDPSKTFTERTLTEASDRTEALKRIRAIAEAEKGSLAGAQAAAAKAHLDLLPILIDNQPQISVIGSYHTPGRLGGPNEIAATFEFHSGRQNLNSVRRKCPGGGTAALGCIQRELTTLAAKGISTDKWVLTATYKKTDDYNVTIADLGLETPPAGFVPVEIKDSNALSVKGQGGFLLGTEMAGKPMRADASLEIVRARNNGVRTPNRAVATLTLSVPLGDNMTVPVSITYANKPAFLGDPNERLGAHLGLSYRIPNLFGNGGQ